MDLATLSALSRLLDEALELPPEQRSDWLEALPPEYEPFKSHLRTLLQRTGAMETDDFLRTVPKFDLPSTEHGEDAQPGGDAAGDTIGPYRLIRALGSGGMASVWLAERTDGMLKRPVALKLPYGGCKRVGLAERMAREREILETLDHPHIARLLDAGLSEQGRPFLALEYVQGEPIDAYCAQHALDLRARLRLFIQIADAVAYAHTKLVVHRDLKPANILVTPEGQAKLLDFGIAKLLEQGLARETQLTQFTGRALTPDYASPEQIAGEPITTASDVYSLGVLLYELLTGNRPYRLKRDSSRALEQAILNVEPVRPSESVADPAMRRALRGDLDTIVLKAMKKAPEQRYSTVSAFSEDIQRYLTGQPVLARPDSSWYRARKFIGRNKVAAASAAAVVVALIAGAAVAGWQARVALAEQARAEEVKEFIASIFREASPYVSGVTTPTALDLLRQARDRLEGRLGDRPEVRVELLAVLGDSLLSMNDVDAADAVLQRAVEEGRRDLGEDHPASLHAQVLQTTVHRFRGRTKEMASALDALLPRLRGAGPASRPYLVIALQNQAHQAIDQGRYAEAITTAAEARELATAVHGSEHMMTIGSSIILATAHLFARNWNEALQVAQHAHEVAQRAFRNNPRHPVAIESRATYAKALAANGHPAEAIPMLKGAIDDLASVFGASSKEVGFYTGELVLYQWRAGEILSSLQSSDLVLQILGSIAEQGSYTHGAAHSLKGVSLLHARRGEQALPLLTTAAQSMKQALGESHPRSMVARANLALAAAYAGDLKSARAQVEELLKELQVTKADRSHARTFYATGVVHRMAGDYTTAVGLQQQALELIGRDTEMELERLEALIESGIASVEGGELSEGLRLLEDAHPSLQRLQTQMTPLQAEALVAIARARMALGEPASALPLLEQANQFWSDFDARSRWAAEAAQWLRRCYAALGRAHEAEDGLARAERPQQTL
ncbi:MAG TPA: protein kinase [Steroidobacteraceae bacterium]